MYWQRHLSFYFKMRHFTLKFQLSSFCLFLINKTYMLTFYVKIFILLLHIILHANACREIMLFCKCKVFYTLSNDLEIMLMIILWL